MNRSKRIQAATKILRAFWLYGSPKGRGWSGAAFEALEALHPAAARCLREEGAEAAWEKFGEETYRCWWCRREVPWEDGVADDMPDVCDSCWGSRILCAVRWVRVRLGWAR